MSEEAASLIFGCAISTKLAKEIEKWQNPNSSEESEDSFDEDMEDENELSNSPSVIQVPDEYEMPYFFGIQLPGGEMGDYTGFDIDPVALKVAYEVGLNELPESIRAKLSDPPKFFNIPYHT